VLYLVSALGCAGAWSWTALVVFRFVCGLAIGGSSVLGPMYIAEIAPASWRGRLVGFFQFNIVFGILVAYLSNYLIGQLNLGNEEWRWDLGVTAIPAAFFFVMLFFIPRSPRWLVKKQRTLEAREVLKATGEPNYDRQLQEIAASIDAEHGHADEPLFSAKYKFPIFLAVSIAFFNQFSGINAVLYYANDIFAAAGLNRLSTFSQSIYIGLANLVGTAAGMLLIDKIGRKSLLLIGAAGTFVCLLFTALIFSSGTDQGRVVWLLVTFICLFALSQGAVIWVYISEIFPTQVRSKGQSLGGSAHWVSDAIIASLFPLAVAQFSRSAPFYFFAGMTALQFVVVLFIYPETKGATLEQLQVRLER